MSVSITLSDDGRTACISIIELPGGMRPQSRPRMAVGKDGRARTYSSKSEELQTWRSRLYFAMKEAVTRGFQMDADTRLLVDMTFSFARPKSHWTKKGRLTSGAAAYPGKNKGDADNLSKPVLDEAERAKAFVNDSQVTTLKVSRRWADARNASDILVVTITEDA